MMPYILIGTQVRLENGPTIVGDVNSDPELIQQLNATRGGIILSNILRVSTTTSSRPIQTTINKKKIYMLTLCLMFLHITSLYSKPSHMFIITLCTPYYLTL